MLLLLWLLVACGVRGPLEAGEYCETTVEAYCDYYLRCGRMAVDDVATCREVFLETCNGVYEPHYAALAAEGRLELSGAGVQACEDHLGDVACDAQLGDLDGACDAMWVGLTPTGGDCAIGIESLVCDAESECVVGLDLCGTCEAAVPRGGECGEHDDCRGADACVDGVCARRGAPGDACSDAALCQLGADCDAGVCVGWTVVAVGDGCDLDHRCPYKSACIGGACVESALIGEACTGVACASGWCDGAVCQPLGDAGTPCGAGSECASGSCDGDTCGDLPGTCFD